MTQPVEPRQAADALVAQFQSQLKKALTLHQQGQLSTAKVIYEAILKAQPDHCDALHLLGVIATQTKNHLLAIELIGRAIEINPQNAAFHYNRGSVLAQIGQLEAAVASYDKAIAINPTYAAAYSNRGNALAQLGQLEAAIASYDKVIAINPHHAATYGNRGNALAQLGQLEAAVASYDKAIAINPHYFDVHHNLGNALAQLGRLDAAIASYDKAIAINPDHAETHGNRGDALAQIGQLDAAVASYDKAIAINPGHAGAHYSRGNALARLGQLEAAIAGYDQAIAIEPDHAAAYGNRGNALAQLGQLDAAVASYDQAIAINPGYVAAYGNRGNALKELNQLDAAIASYDQAIAIDPDFAEAHYNRGNAQAQLKQLDAAVASYDRAIAINPDSAEVHYNRGNALAELKRLDAAVASYDRAVAINPGFAVAHSNRGVALRELGQLDAAVASYDKAIAIELDYAEAYSNRGYALARLSRFDAALASYDRAIALKPGENYAEGGRLYVKRQMCDWSDVDEDCRRLIASVAAGRAASPPYSFTALPTSHADQLACARLYADDRFGAIPPLPPRDTVQSHGDRIRIAYLSSDLRDHAIGHLTAGLFERHDRTRFETWAVSLAPAVQSAMRERMVRAFDHFVDACALSDEAVARLIRDQDIDIVVDLNGYTEDARTGILARRPAPIQVNYLGYPGTMAVDFIDYIIADRIVLPLDEQPHYSERIVHLPDCYQVNDSQRRAAAATPSRSEVGLPESGFVFCCFNNNFKIAPPVFDVWMRLLRSVEGAVLWLLGNNRWAVDNLRKEAAARGVEPMRLIFAERVPQEQHLARHRLADLFLDTLPYNAHTTASDALWMGVPVLTCIGQTFASRVAASVLRALELDELVTESLDRYETLALALARAPEELRFIRQRLERNRLSCPLFDTDRFRRNIEAAYATMWDLHRRGEPPRNFSV